MTEDYLHFMWKHKRLLSPDLTTVDGQPISVLNFGIHNMLLKGPDFNHGTIRMDGIEFHGPIEIHVKSSDWYAHYHHEDENYNNVILHVVYEHDKEVIQNGRKLPVLELKKHIDQLHWAKHKQFAENAKAIICKNELSNIDSIYLHMMKEKSIMLKLNEKVKLIESYLTTGVEPLYFFIAAAFGSNLNKRAFLDLVRKVPQSELVKLPVEKRYRLLLSESGMITNEPLANQWHFKGTRPGNFPTVRIKQFAGLAGEIQFLSNYRHASIQSIKEQLIASIDEFNYNRRTLKSRLSNSFRNNIIINGIVPYLWFLSNQYEDERYQSEALELLESIDPEQNSILKKWKSAGVEIANAFDSQGLLALYKYNCCRKKCLSCAVGNKVLNY